MMQESYTIRIEKARKAVQQAEFIVIGAGAGLSAAAGLDYHGKRFTDNFGPFIEKYKFQDLYTSSFYPFESQEEKWAYWAKQIYLNRYETPSTNLYIRLLEMFSNKNYFVITTNVESQFEKAGFEKERIFEVQGNYAYLQCATACHDKLYFNESLISRMISETEDCRIPGRLVPKCPVCGGEMDVNLRKDRYFVQDKNWYQSEKSYREFITGAINSNVAFLELGVGYNTPSIIRFPSETMLFNNPNAVLIRLNLFDPAGNEKNRDFTVAFNEEMPEVINDILNSSL
jgi:NAD-dependent SIR2 family protein deacetylase